MKRSVAWPHPIEPMQQIHPSLLRAAHGVLGLEAKELDLSHMIGESSISSSRSPRIVFGSSNNPEQAFSLIETEHDIPTLLLMIGGADAAPSRLSDRIMVIDTGINPTVCAASSSALLCDFKLHVDSHERLLETFNGDIHGYEQAVQSWLNRTVQSGWTCVDVGSHIGLLTMVMAKRVGPTGKVLAFDAFEQNAKDVQSNCNNYGFGKIVTARWCAVTNGEAPEVTLYSGRHNWSAEWNLSGIDVEGNSSTSSITVPASSLDQLLGEHRVDLIKIDVEGAALGVVEGMKGVLERSSPTLFIEYHGSRELVALMRLQDAGYRFYDLKSSEELSVGTFSYHMWGVRGS